MEKLEYYKKYDGQKIASPAYGFAITYDYYNLKKRFLALKTKFIGSDKNSPDVIDASHCPVEKDICAGGGPCAGPADTDVLVQSVAGGGSSIAETVVNTSGNDGESATPLKTKKVITIRKCPKESANNYEVGFKKQAPNGAIYIVKEYSKGETKYKKWVKTTEFIKAV